MQQFCNKSTSKLFTFIPAFLIWFIKSTGLSKRESIRNHLLGYLILTKIRLPVTEKLLEYDSYHDASCILENQLRKPLSRQVFWPVHLQNFSGHTRSLFASELSTSWNGLQLALACSHVPTVLQKNCCWDFSLCFAQVIWMFAPVGMKSTPFIKPWESYMALWGLYLLQVVLTCCFQMKSILVCPSISHVIYPLNTTKISE